MEVPEKYEHRPIETTPVFEIFEAIADWSWVQVQSWALFERDTVGKQLVRSVDSINANLAEGDGRYSDLDALRRLVTARGSARESKLWLERAAKRGLIDDDATRMQVGQIEEATRELNLLLNYRRKTANKNIVREETAEYA